MKEHDAPLHGIDFVPYFEDIHVDYEPGTAREVRMPDGSTLVLQKLGDDYDATDRDAAFGVLRKAQKEQKLVTGLLYVDPNQQPYCDDLDMVKEPLASLPLERVRPPKAVLDGVMEQLRTGKGLEAKEGGG